MNSIAAIHLAALSLSVCLSGWLMSGEKTPPKADKPDAPPPVLKSRFSPRDVEVRLQDGSLFRGEIDALETVVIKTLYGTLTVPISDMLRIDRGERVSEKDTKDIAETLKDLDNEEFAKRSAAQYKLETMPAAAAETLKAARGTASPEAKNRIDTILKKLAAKAQNKRIQTEDSVRTVRFEATGTLQFDTVKIKSRVGELAIKLDDLQTVRWLNRGEQKSLTLEPNATMGEWVDTGIDSFPGDKIAVAVTGTINPFNNQEISPTGTDNWGNAGQFMMGAVVGKLGSSGDSFLVGNGKIWQTETKERLYLKINWNHNRTGRSNEATKGKFSVRIATGSWADDIDATGIQAGGQ